MFSEGSSKFIPKLHGQFVIGPEGSVFLSLSQVERRNYECDTHLVATYWGDGDLIGTCDLFIALPKENVENVAK